MRIDEYLTELSRLVPRRRRRRFVEEAQSHLEDAAAKHESRGLTREEAEEAAVGEFGVPAAVARRLSSVGAIWELRTSTVLTLAVALVFVVPLYGIPENTLPPATWVEKPTDVHVLQLATVTIWFSAVALGLFAAALSWTRRRRLAARIAMAVPAAIALSTIVSAVLVVRWFSYAPPTAAWPLLAAPAAFLCLGACLGAALWARSRARVLD